MSLRLLGACLILALGQGAAQAQAHQARVAVVVGNNLGHDPARTLRFAEAEAGKLASLLRSAGEFDSVVTVQGARRQAVEEALAAARTQLDRAHAEASGPCSSSTIRATVIRRRSSWDRRACLCAICVRISNSSPGRTCAWRLSTPASRARSPV